MAHGDGSFGKRLAQLARLDLLILDDFGIAPIAAHERNDLLELLDDRVGTRSTLITSQLPVTAWHAWLDEPTLADAIQRAPRVELEVPFAARLALVRQDYAWLGRDPEALAQRLAALRGLHPNDTLQRWQQWARQGRLDELFAELMALHYDPLYRRALPRGVATTVWPLPDVTPATLQATACAWVAAHP